MSLAGIAQCVRWYLVYSLSLRNLEEIMAERGIVVDHSTGQTIDFLLTAKQDAAATLRFFRKAIGHHGEPEVVTIDKRGANTTALAALNVDKPNEKTITDRQSKYLNNLVEQDHRNIKRQIRPILGFKSFRRTQTVKGHSLTLFYVSVKGW
ncbi:IS6 family transposase [Serratia sp. UGAL515B_01]|uniref:IS6 family transposase n=1 Tax=Serratia sp. UGAL515B_01 TaxID=2986763 RepID=UPI0039869DB7